MFKIFVGKIAEFVRFTGAITSQYVVKPVKETCETVHSIPKETCQKMTQFDEPYKSPGFWGCQQDIKRWTCVWSRVVQICGVLPCLSYDSLTTLQGACSVCKETCKIWIGRKSIGDTFFQTTMTHVINFFDLFQRHSLLYCSVWPIPWANLSHHRVQQFAITTITDRKPINRWGKPIHPVLPSTCSCFATAKEAKKLITCIIVVWKNVSPIDFLPGHVLQVSFGQCRPLAASQITRRNHMEVLHKFAQP